MSLYALLEYNAVFSRAAALSPSVWTSPSRLKNLVKTSRIQPDTVLYMDYGSREIGLREHLRDQFEELSLLLLQKEIFLTNRIVPYGEHCEASWEKQLPFVLHTLTYEA